MSEEKFVIIGGGIGGVTAASELRERKPHGKITIISKETGLPYIRPLLSKLSFERLPEEQLRLHNAKWYQTRNIDLISGKRVVEIKLDSKTVILEGGECIPYTRLIYALGAETFVPAIKGSEKGNVISLRDISDFREMQKAILRSKRVVVIGGGAVGLETAWELRRYGLAVTLLENEAFLLGRFIDEETSNWLQDRAQVKGVRIITDMSVSAIIGDDVCTGICLKDGSWLNCDLVVISCGIRASIQLAKSSGLACDRGVLVTSQMETNEADVFACGDCIQLQTGDENPGLWTYSIETAKRAGRFAADGNIKAEKQPAQVDTLQTNEFLLNAFDTSLFSIGNIHAKKSETEIINPDSEDSLFQVNPLKTKNGFIKRFYQNEQLVGAILAGNLSAIAQVKEEIKAGIR